MRPAMKVLGAILAGGASRRFGSDKAEALIAGEPMLCHVAHRLSAQTDGLVICGRSWRSLRAVADRPRPGMGPLGGLAGALRHAGDHGFDLVLTAACDMPDIPPGLVERLGPAPSVVKGQQLVGLWPASLAAELEAHLDETGDYSVKAWMGRTGARQVEIGQVMSNINTSADLDAFTRRAGPRSSP